MMTFFTACDVCLREDRLTFGRNFVLAAPVRVRESLYLTPGHRPRNFVHRYRSMAHAYPMNLHPVAGFTAFNTTFPLV